MNVMTSLRTSKQQFFYKVKHLAEKGILY